MNVYLDNIERAIKRIDNQLITVVRQASVQEYSYEPGEISDLWNDLEALSKMKQWAIKNEAAST